MKKSVCVLLSLLLLLALVLPVQARETVYVYDEAGILSYEEREALDDIARQISQAQECAVYFVTVPDYRAYGSGSVYEVAKRIYLGNDFGWGQEKSGVMLLLSMEDRDYSLIAYGYGNTAFTDYGKDSLSEEFLDDFRDDDWAAGCRDYLTGCEKLLSMARAGTPLDVGVKIPKEPMTFGDWVILWLKCLAGSFLVSLLICGIWLLVAKQKVREQSRAAGYLEQGSLNITRRVDRYTHTTVVRTKIEKDPPKSSGGTTVGSSGFSGKSGKF